MALFPSAPAAPDQLAESDQFVVAVTPGLPIQRAVLAAMAASTALWIGNPGVTATTNWSDSANWSGAAGALGNNAIFGSTGVAGAAGTVTSAVDVNQHPATLAFTNASSQFHTVFIPSGVGLTNDGTLTVGGQAVNGYVTVVGMAGGGTLVQLGSATIGNNGSS